MRDQPTDDKAVSPAWVTLAILKRPQGRKGELLAERLTDFPARFLERPDVFLAKPGFNGVAAAARPATIVSAWLPVGRNQGRVVLGFAGIDSISAAETLNGLEVIVPEQERVELDDDETYISDLTGCSLYAIDDGQQERLVGTVEDVEFPTSADGSRRLDDAAPLLVVGGPAGEEILIPYVREFLLRLELPERRIVMRLPPGLLELNRVGGTD